jgi:hypothetical protein
VANFSYIRAAGIWSAGSVLLSSEMASFDAMRPKLINAEDGSTHTPTSLISITGGFGFWIETFHAGGTGAGTAAAFTATSTGTTFNKNVNFENDATFADVTTFDSTAEFNGAVTLDGNVAVNSSVVTLGALTTTTNNGTLNNANIFANTGTGKITTAGNKIELTDGAKTFPARNPTVASTNHNIPIGAAVSDNAATTVKTGNSSNVGCIVMGNIAGSTANIDLHIRLNHNVQYTSITVRIKGDGGHGGTAPAVFPIATLYAVSQNGAFTSISTASVPGGTSAATYDAGVDLSLSFPSAAPATASHYIVRISSETGAGSRSDMHIVSVRGTGTIATMGNTGE